MAAQGFPDAPGHLHRCVIIYMDDLLCYSSTLEQCLKDVFDVLSILRLEKLYVKAKKCYNGGGELVFLGHRLSAGGG